MKESWITATKEVQAGKLDDRPLYWARNKMQTWLKRHPIYKSDYDFEKSIVTKGSDLDDMIVLFEEKSRNYKGIDFSKAIADPVKIAKAEIEMKKAEKLLEDATNLYLADNTGNKQLETDHKLAQEAHKKAKEALEKSKKVKKVLVTGFDPFVLNPDKNCPTQGNPLQSNPSGINALAMHNTFLEEKNHFVQTFICPVRYADFDMFKDAKGIIELFVAPYINQVDAIITVSQGDIFRFDIDRFSAKHRGGFMDNMLWGEKSKGYNEEFFKQLGAGEEFYETTLPYQKMVSDKNDSKDIFWIYFNQTYNPSSGGDYDKTTEGTKLRTKLSDIKKVKSRHGSGGAYLSNEIFYRVAKLREEQRPKLPTGHLHVPLTQYRIGSFDNRGNEITVDINPKIKELIEIIQKLISEI